MHVWQRDSGKSISSQKTEKVGLIDRLTNLCKISLLIQMQSMQPASAGGLRVGARPPMLDLTRKQYAWAFYLMLLEKYESFFLKIFVFHYQPFFPINHL